MYKTLIFLIIFLVGLGLSILFLIMTNKKKSSFYWNLFLGITIFRFIAVYPLTRYIVFDDSIDLTLALFHSIYLYISFFISLILLIVGIVTKSNLKKNNPESKIKFSILFLIVIVLLILISLLFIVLIPRIKYNNKKSVISNKVITYFNNKYGDNEFNIKSFENDYSYNGFVQSNHTGYKLYVNSSLINDEFEVGTDLEGNVEMEGFNCSRNFLTNYFYNEYGFVYDINSHDYLSPNKKYYIDLDICSDKIPDNYGKIPIYDELIELEATGYGIDIYLSENDANKYIDNINSRIEYIGEITSDLINTLGISKDIDFNFVGKGTFKYDIKKVGNYLIISGNNFHNNKDTIKGEYTFDISTMKIIDSKSILN